MNIYAPFGSRVQFMNRNGYDHDLREARKYLTPLAKYTVSHTVVEAWSSRVYLVGFPDIAFNTVMFEDA